MARQTKAEREADKLIEKTYYANFSGVQIPIMEIPKIYDTGRKALVDGRDLVVAMKEHVERVKV